MFEQVPTHLYFSDESLAGQHLLQQCEHRVPHRLDLARFLQIVLFYQIQLGEVGESEYGSLRHFFFLVVYQLDQLGVEMLEGLLRVEVVRNVHQLPANVPPHFPVKVLADVLDNGEEVLLVHVR